MATVDTPSSHREELGIVINAVGSRFADIATVLMLAIIAVMPGIRWQI